MSPSRLADIRHWLDMCDGTVPQREWAHVVRELIAGVELLQTVAVRPTDLLDTAAVAKVVNVCPRTVTKWCDQGRLRSHREEGTNNHLVWRLDLADFMREHGMPISGSGLFSEAK